MAGLERERERQGERQKEREIETISLSSYRILSSSIYDAKILKLNDIG